jgi:predicted phage terminase large subunit-like protein
MPPQHGKSELCSKYLPAWFLGTHPDERVVLVSYEADFAASWGRKARDLLDQQGHLLGVRVSKRSSAVQRWDLEGHEGGMCTAGMGGAITGKGAHLLIIDDPLKNDEEARNPRTREKQWEWWQSVASTRIRPGGLFVVVQTRWHRDDLAGRILRQAQSHGQRWLSVRLPALAEANDPLGRAPGEALWPEMYPTEFHEQTKATRSTYYWRSLYQQDPIAEGGTEWPSSYFDDHIWFEEWPQRWVCRVLAIDPSKGTESKLGDYTAFVLVQLGHDGMMYVDAWLEHCNTAVLLDLAAELQREYRCDGIAIEGNQFQFLLADELDRRAGGYWPVYSLQNHVQKLVRIRRLTGLLARQQFRFRHGSPGARKLVGQLRDFPVADHDDGPDALEMALRLQEALLNQPDPVESETTFEVWGLG